MMPKLKSPFARLPSAPLPGSSYYISNTVIIAKRVALGLEAPIRIKSDKWADGNPLYDWLQRYSNVKIESIQLRKEQKAPFFHEYIAIELSNGSYFRIDRRQLPDEQSPMSSTERNGVEAYDTIEQITSLDDSMYNPSDYLVQIYFERGVNLSVIAYTCDAISKDFRASAYTLQRYNCYFYAQTILLCTLCEQLSVPRRSAIWVC
ncbi:unnamed protein product [Rhizoctonia solani]|uniref:Uncharacterized protein n=1 Tax=Rhizoctonia solani TaxID=456999 RepID=A0A8H3C3N1_9AGAM|nr:unnamed protein product [Rhizoctonia solani]